MIILRNALFLALFLAAILASGKAEASLLLCNRTKAPLEAALGYRDDSGWISEGWWKIEPGLCARAYGKPLSQRFYFYFARALNRQSTEGKDSPVWTGKYAFCIDDKAFHVMGDGNCEKRKYKTQGFHEIDLGTGKVRDYTLNFQ